jgi:hypothetical protein
MIEQLFARLITVANPAGVPGDTDSLGSASPKLSVAARNVKADNTGQARQRARQQGPATPNHHVAARETTGREAP